MDCSEQSNNGADAVAGTVKEFDIVVFGASGFTGARVVKYFCTKVAAKKKIAIAGRNRNKLCSALEEFGHPSYTILDGIDVSVPGTLLSMAARSKMVVNCVGPFRFHGEAVVQACVLAGTDYLDVTGEPEFMERMQLKYGDSARESSCFITSAAGFDSIPADIGAILATTALAEKGLTPYKVDSYLSFDCGPRGVAIHATTLQLASRESAIHGMRNISTLKRIRAEAKAAGLNPAPVIEGPKPTRPPPCKFSDRFKGWCMPFPDSEMQSVGGWCPVEGSDASVVRRSMSARQAMGLPVAHYSASFIIRSRWNLWMFSLFGGLVQLACKCAAGAALVMRFPAFFTCGCFTHAGPSQQQMDSTSFRMVHFGFPTPEEPPLPDPQPQVIVDIQGPEPGYIATPIFVAEAALEVLENRDSIANCLGQGGVFTPGQLLLTHGTDYMKRIRDAGVIVDTSV